MTVADAQQRARWTRRLKPSFFTAFRFYVSGVGFSHLTRERSQFFFLGRRVSSVLERRTHCNSALFWRSARSGRWGFACCRHEDTGICVARSALVTRYYGPRMSDLSGPFSSHQRPALASRVTSTGVTGVSSELQPAQQRIGRTTARVPATLVPYCNDAFGGGTTGTSVSVRVGAVTFRPRHRIWRGGSPRAGFGSEPFSHVLFGRVRRGSPPLFSEAWELSEHIYEQYDTGL